MKRASTTVFGIAGLLCGLVAVLLVYAESPVGLQTFIVFGVTAVCASAGWLLGTLAGLLPMPGGKDKHGGCNLAQR